MSASSPDETPAAGPEPALRFRHIPLLLIGLSAVVTQPYASSIGELALSAAITVLALTPPAAQLLRCFRGRGETSTARSRSPVRDWLGALAIVALANLVYLINLTLLRGALLAR